MCFFCFPQSYFELFGGMLRTVKFIHFTAEKQEVRMRILLLLVPLTGVEPVCLSARDFKSLVSANSTTATSSEQSLTANDYSF